jgi:hypothetical protein
MSEDRVTPDRGLAQELIGDMAQLLNNTRPTMLLDGGILAALTLGISLEAAFARSPQWQGIAGTAAGVLLPCLIASWLTAVTKLLLAGRPVLGIVSDHRWKAGAPLDPRARWLSLPPIEATPEEWTWVRAHLLVGAVRIRMDRVQRALTWCLITTALFLTWTAITFFGH